MQAPQKAAAACAASLSGRQAQACHLALAVRASHPTSPPAPPYQPAARPRTCPLPAAWQSTCGTPGGCRATTTCGASQGPRRLLMTPGCECASAQPAGRPRRTSRRRCSAGGEVRAVGMLGEATASLLDYRLAVMVSTSSRRQQAQVGSRAQERPLLQCLATSSRQLQAAKTTAT